VRIAPAKAHAIQRIEKQQDQNAKTLWQNLAP
jgi:hypothetical protein